MDLTLLVINIVAGAFVGYVTKTLAINMLFKKYPIIGGAEIIKDRENLAISISELVEERLIKPSTLVEEFEKEAFKKSFQTLIQHIVENTIESTIKTKNISTFQDIEGSTKTSENLKEFLFFNQEKILPNAMETLYKTIEFRDFLTSEQIENIVQKLIQLLSESITKNLSSISDTFFQELEKKSVNDFLDKKDISNLISNIVPDDLSNKIEKELNDDIHLLFKKIYEKLDIDSTVEKIELSIKDKTFSDLIAKTESENELTINAIINRLLDFINSEKGKIILIDFIDTCVEVLKTLDIPLSSLLTKNIENTAINFIEKNMPEIITRLEIWLEINKKDVEYMLNEAIEEHLESEGLIKQVVGNIFSQEISQRYRVVESTLNEIKKLVYNSDSDLVKTINRFLDNTQIGDLTAFIEEKITDKEIIFDIIFDLINKYIPKINLDFFDPFLDKKLADIWLINEIDFKKVFKNYGYTYLTSKIKTEILYNPKLKPLLVTTVNYNFEKIAQHKLKDLTTKDFFDSLTPLINNFVNDKKFQETIIKKASENLPNILGDKKVNDLLTEEIKKEVYPKFINLYKEKVSDFLLILKREKISYLYSGIASFYQKVSKNEDFSKQLTESLITFMNNLIKKHKLLDGKIKIAIKESFAKFTDDELKDEMNSFMGQELQPIKLLGAFLGALIGIAMYNISFLPSYGEYVKGYWALLTYSLSYGITEVGTNWMAIKMLFKPYRPTTIPALNINLPFSQGVFPKNKKALAESMVNFIDKKLLSKENMIEILEKHQEKWKEVIKKAISANDYELIDNTLYQYMKNNYDSTTEVVLEIAFKEISNNKEIIAEYLIQEIKKVHLNYQDLEYIKTEISSKLNESKNITISFIEKEFLNNKGFLSTKIDEIVSKKLINETSKSLFITISKYIKNYFTLEKVEELLLKNQEAIDSLLNKKIYEHFNDSEIEVNKKNIINYFENKLKEQKVQDLLFNYIEVNLIKRDIKSDKKLNQFFDGKIINLILKEADGIVDNLSEYIVEIAKNKKEALTKVIISDIEKKGVFESILVRFGGVKKDVKKIIDIVIDYKLQPYIESKKSELKIILKSYIENSFSKLTLSDLGLKQDVFDSENIRKVLQKNLFNNTKLFAVLNTLLGNLANDLINNLTIKEVAILINIESLDELKKRFKNEIEILSSDFPTLLDKTETLQDEVVPLINKILSLISSETDLTVLLKSLGKEKTLSLIYEILDFIYSSETLEKIKADFLSEAMKKANNEFYKFLDYDILNRDLAKMLHKLTSKETDNIRSLNFQSDIKEMLRDITFKFVEVINQNVEQETKVVIEDIFVTSLIDSLRINNREVLEPINFDKIIRKAVHEMEGERIEAMFDFAKPIFKLLVWYGALGGIIGLVVGIFEASRIVN